MNKIRKAPGAKFNTYMKHIVGMTTDKDMNIKPDIYEVHFTSDANGETLSIGNEDTQLTVRFCDLEDLIRETRKHRGKVS